MESCHCPWPIRNLPLCLQFLALLVRKSPQLLHGHHTLIHASTLSAALALLCDIASPETIKLCKPFPLPPNTVPSSMSLLGGKEGEIVGSHFRSSPTKIKWDTKHQQENQ